jgi:hypothetical protein
MDDGSHKDVQDVWCAIYVLFIMHNMCLWHDNHPKQLEDYQEDLGNGRSGED